MNTVVLKAFLANHSVLTADALADQEVHQLLHVALGIEIDDGIWRFRVLLLVQLQGTVRRRRCHAHLLLLPLLLLSAQRRGVYLLGLCTGGWGGQLE